MNIVEARQVTKTYTVDYREICVLDNVSLSVSESEFLVVEGSSGSGIGRVLRDNPAIIRERENY